MPLYFNLLQTIADYMFKIFPIFYIYYRNRNYLSCIKGIYFLGLRALECGYHTTYRNIFQKEICFKFMEWWYSDVACLDGLHIVRVSRPIQYTPRPNTTSSRAAPVSWDINEKFQDASSRPCLVVISTAYTHITWLSWLLHKTYFITGIYSVPIV
jgi:hypothetical protein